MYLLRYTFRVRRAPQINLGRPETYRASGRLVISLLQGHIRVMSDQKKKRIKRTYATPNSLKVASTGVAQSQRSP